MRLTLRDKILLLIAGTAIGLVTTILMAFGFFASREVRAAVRADVHATESVLAQLVRERSATQQDQCRLTARLPILKAVISTDDPATVADTARDYRQQLGLESVLVTDRDGRVLSDTDGEYSPRAYAYRSQGVATAVAGRDWTGIVARRGRLMLTVSVPVFNSGYVFGTLTTFRAIDPALAGQLRDALGTDVAFLFRGQVVSASLPLSGRLPTPQGTPRLVTLNRNRYLALYGPLPGTAPRDGMGFLTLRPYDAAMAHYQSGLVDFTVVAALVLVFALGAGGAVARSLTRPLDGVVLAAQTLREGGWPERFDVRRSDEVGLLQSVFNDMTAAMKESRETLLALIDTDPLTGLDNHRQFQERLAQEAKRCARSGEDLSLLLLDIDRFQHYNQVYGHAAGDEAVRRVGQTLRGCLPEVAVSARYGGEEFAVLLPQHTLDQAEAIAELVRGTAAGLGLGLTLSVGCAEFGTHTSEGEGLILAAELAVSRAKQLGRDRVCRFDSVPGADQTADPYQLYRAFHDNSLATIQALAAAVDAKDPYTRGHSQRVAQYAATLARALDLSNEDVELVHTTGTLHDVGKIGVPDAILKKPARLTEEERQVMETHPALGEVIVRKAPLLVPTLPGVRHHHERWDGGGYPDGLAGEEIPRLGRLLAVADTFDAMTSDRPYRKGLSWDIALDEIARGAGTQFDPEFATTFVQLMRVSGIQAEAA